MLVGCWTPLVRKCGIQSIQQIQGKAEQYQGTGTEKQQQQWSPERQHSML
jgi:hypothetical protein